MNIPKRYGQGMSSTCMFCGSSATTTNEQSVPVCISHKKAILNDFKCVCGEYLDLRSGKFGLYFSCMNCGNINMNKALEVNEVKDISKSS